MESISYGVDVSKLLELHERGRTHLLNLPSICISLLIKKLGKVTAPHILGCEIPPLFWILQWDENFNTCLKPRTAKAERCYLCPLLIMNIYCDVICLHS